VDRKRLTLDNPAFKDTLRYGHRSVAYVRRPMQTQTMSDVQRVSGVRSAPVVAEAPEQITLEPAAQTPMTVPHYMPDVAAPKPIVVGEVEKPQFLPDVVAPTPAQVRGIGTNPVQSETSKTVPEKVARVHDEAPQAMPPAQYMPDIMPPKPVSKSPLPTPENFQTLQDIISAKSRVTATRPKPTITLREDAPTPDESQPERVIAPEPESDQGSEVPVVQPKKHRRLKPTKQGVLYMMAATVFVVGLLVSFNGLRTNKQVAAQVKKSQSVSDATADASTIAPSTTKPTTAQVTNYAVSPNVPRYVDIPKLKVHARTLSEGVDTKGALQVPWNIYDTGWYNASSQPGQNGATLIDGHSGIGGMHGVFYNLASLSAGDQVIVTRGDGQKFTYIVSKVQTVNVQDVDMGSMLVSANTNKPGLNLITCTGDQIPGTDQLNKRVLVYAVMQ